MVTTFVTVKVGPAARQAAQRLQYALTGFTSSRVSVSDAIEAACHLAMKHLSETAALIGEDSEP